MRLLSGLVIWESSFWQQKLSRTVRSDALTAWTLANLLIWSIVSRSLLAKMLLALRVTLLTSCVKILEVREWKKDRERTRGGGFMDWSHVLSALQLSSQSRRHIKIRAALETRAQMLIQTFSSLWITILSDFDSLRTFFHVIRSFSSHT